MPYIERGRRKAARTKPANPGELNFALTKLCVEYTERLGMRYLTVNDVLGALDGAAREYYRRIVIPLEEGKRKKHGDVYGGLA